MTCFWDGILRSLEQTDFQFTIGQHKKLSKKEFISWLKRNNRPPVNIRWNNQQLTNQEMKEHVQTINCYNIHNISHGHLCGSCDPFLLLIAELFCVSIKHSYLNKSMTYTNIKNSRKTLHFVSNWNHFQYIRR